MAKVRCAKCGEIFGLQQGDIQVCPVCGCRMKVNRKPQADYRTKSYDAAQSRPSEPAAQRTSGPDEYDTLRREYMDMMREKLEKNKKGEDGVYLTREEYDALVKKAAAPAEPASAPTFRQAAPAYSEPAAPAPDDYARYDAPEEEPAADYDEPVKKKSSAKTLINWLSFLFALLAGVMSALLLVFEALKDTELTGMDLFLPNKGFQWPDTIVMGIIFFVPALCAVYALISSAIKGKTSKFILMLLYLVCAAAMLFMPFFWSLMQGTEFSTDLIVDSFGKLSMFDIIAVVLSGLAFLVMFIAGIVTPKKRKAAETDDELL